MTVIKIAVFIVLLVIGIVFFTLYRNDANLFHEPGFSDRLVTYFTTNTAATSDNHKFEELRTPVYELNSEELYERVIFAATELGWEVVAPDSDNQNVIFVVRSPIFLYEDDVYVQVQFIDTEKSSLHIQSSSRKGKADLAANSGHIQALIKKIKR